MLLIKVGGNILRTVKGKILNYAKGEIIYNSEKEVIETAPIIEYGPAEPHPPREEPLALACIEFLPGEGPDPTTNPYIKGETKKLKYAGSFGFDYFRKKKSLIKYEKPYFEALTTNRGQTGYYKAESNSVQYQRYPNRKEQYDALCREYERQRISYRNKKEITEGWEDEHAYYYVPYLTLYSKEYTDTLTTKYKPCYQAYLAMAVEIVEEIDGWEFEYDKTLFTHSLETPLETQQCMPTLHMCNLKITCLKDFDREQEIRVYALPKGSKNKSEMQRKNVRQPAGKIIVLPNSEKYRKKIKVLAVQIKTDVKNNGAIQQGEFYEEQMVEFHKFFNQAYIEPQLEFYTAKDKDLYLDLTQDRKFKKDTNYITIDGEMRINTPSLLQECQDYLETLLPQDKKDHLVLYFFGMQSPINETTIRGGSAILQSKRSFIYRDESYESKVSKKLSFRHPSVYTPVHEAGHALGLWHSFHNELGKAHQNGKYFFALGSTGNLMDYTSERYFLYKWQWDILRKEL